MFQTTQLASAKELVNSSNGQISTGGSLHAYLIPSGHRFIKLSAVMAMTALSRSSVYRLVAEGKLPPMHKLTAGGHASGWLLSEIETFIQKRVQDRGAA